MATLKHFSQLEAWQVARELARQVYAECRTGSLALDCGLRDQMQRAAVSAMANIAEGFGRGGTAEFIQYLSVARGSAAEVESLAYVAFDQGYLTQPAFDDLKARVATLQRLNTALMRYLRSSGYRGSKFLPEPLNL